jgi:branched-chain amino acid transport system permease protein
MQRYLADFGASYLILLGTLGILVMLFAPRAIWGLISERYDLALFPTRRKLVIHPDNDDRA